MKFENMPASNNEASKKEDEKKEKISKSKIAAIATMLTAGSIAFAGSEASAQEANGDAEALSQEKSKRIEMTQDQVQEQGVNADTTFTWDGKSKTLEEQNYDTENDKETMELLRRTNKLNEDIMQTSDDLGFNHSFHLEYGENGEKNIEGNEDIEDLNFVKSASANYVYKFNKEHNTGIILIDIDADGEIDDAFFVDNEEDVFKQVLSEVNISSKYTKGDVFTRLHNNLLVKASSVTLGDPAERGVRYNEDLKNIQKGYEEVLGEINDELNNMADQISKDKQEKKEEKTRKINESVDDLLK